MAWEPMTQRTALIPMIWINWVFGLGVIELAGRPRYNLTIIYNLTRISLYFILLFAWNFKDDQHWIAYQKISYVFVLWVNIIVAVIAILLGLIYAECTKKIIVKCEQIDNTLEVFGVDKNYTKTLRDVACAIIIWWILVLILCGMDMLWLMGVLNERRAVYLCCLMHLPISINALVIVSFCILMRILCNKLQKINVTMKEIALHYVSNMNHVKRKYNMPLRMIQKITVSVSYSERKQLVQSFLEITRHIHLEIVKISRELNKVYCYQLLLELIVEFTLIMGALYNLYFEIIKSDITEIMKNKLVLEMCLWIIVNSIKVITVNNVCTDLYREAQQAAQTLREIENCSVDDYMRNEIQQFSLQLILHPLYFSAGGFVCLNNRLTTVFFGTIMTYMAILMQMSSTPRAMKSLTETLSN